MAGSPRMDGLHSGRDGEACPRAYTGGYRCQCGQGWTGRAAGVLSPPARAAGACAPRLPSAAGTDGGRGQDWAPRGAAVGLARRLRTRGGLESSRRPNWAAVAASGECGLFGLCRGRRGASACPPAPRQPARRAARPHGHSPFRAAALCGAGRAVRTMSAPRPVRVPGARTAFLDGRTEWPMVTAPTLAQVIPVLREVLCDDKKYSTKELIDMVCDRFEVGEDDRDQMSEGATCDAAIAVWVATATLHRKHGSDGPFTIKQITEMVERQGMWKKEICTIKSNISTHCVANSKRKSPKSSRQCKLTRVDAGVYRLFREGDEIHPDRRGNEIHPDRRDSKKAPGRDKLPVGYKGLRKWYDDVYCDWGRTEPPRGADDAS